MSDTEVLTDLLTQKLACLGELREYAPQQMSLIDSQQIDELLKLLSNKQRLLDRMSQVDKSLDQFRGQPPESREWASAEAREHCKRLNQACNQLLDSIMQQEQAAQEELVIRRDTIKQQLNITEKNGKVLSAYRTQNHNTSSGRLDIASDA